MSFKTSIHLKNKKLYSTFKSICALNDVKISEIFENFMQEITKNPEIIKYIKEKHFIVKPKN